MAVGLRNLWQFSVPRDLSNGRSRLSYPTTDCYDDSDYRRVIKIILVSNLSVIVCATRKLSVAPTPIKRSASEGTREARRRAAPGDNSRGYSLIYCKAVIILCWYSVRHLRWYRRWVPIHYSDRITISRISVSGALRVRVEMHDKWKPGRTLTQTPHPSLIWMELLSPAFTNHPTSCNILLRDKAR